MRNVILGLALMLALPMARGWSDEQETRWRHLNEELRCLVCQNQSIAESHADLAKDLRRQTREMIEAGRTDAEIRAYMTDRYGDFVLYRPPFKAKTLLLWLGPGLMLLLGLGLVWRLRQRARATPEPARKDLNALLEEAERD